MTYAITYMIYLFEDRARATIGFYELDVVLIIVFQVFTLATSVFNSRMTTVYTTSGLVLLALFLVFSLIKGYLYIKKRTADDSNPTRSRRVNRCNIKTTSYKD